MIGCRLILALVFGLATFLPAQAGAPLKSLRPMARPAAMDAASTAAASTVGARTDGALFLSSAKGVVTSIRPIARPSGPADTTVQRQPARAQPVQATTVRAGAICGKRAIRGERLATIPGRLPGCGVKNPVRVFAVSGVTLSQPATLNCTSAKALNKWVKDGVKPAVGRLGGGVASLQVLSSYSCRTRNSKPGAKISEHAKGNAIDIAAINLKNGMSVNVLDGWNNRVQGKLLRRIHRSACGPFGTVLGPDSDRFHRNHFHLDTARYRGGSYCR